MNTNYTWLRSMQENIFYAQALSRCERRRRQSRSQSLCYPCRAERERVTEALGNEILGILWACNLGQYKLEQLYPNPPPPPKQ